MPLTPGEKLGPYEIVAPLGAGGFGEVYKARDTRLDRTVAVKVLPERIAQREELRARFEREARAVASLNHPNICSLFDIGPGYMAMELIDGETLAARISKGAIPLEQALKYAVQIADALDRAHRAGVTHRDVKPQNIMITRDGVKVLDFGLAKAAAASKPGPTEETLTVLTTEGTVMGTPQYMAPELFEGKEADARADIWAFGAVLYEMVTGRKAFEGKNYASLVGAILSANPAPVTPGWLGRLVKRCLEKDPEERYQSMRDLVLDLRNPPMEAAIATTNRWPWAIAAAAMTLIAVGLAAVHFTEKPVVAPETRVDIVTPPTSSPGSFAISPDGRKLAYAANSDGASRLWVRSLDSDAAQALPATEGAVRPFWSPDGKSLGFFAENKLNRIDLAGGQPQPLAEIPTTASNGAWTADGMIVFAYRATGPLERMPAGGGPSTVLTSLAEGEIRHYAPRLLPGSRQFLFASYGASTGAPGALWLGSLDGNRPRRIAEFDAATESPAEFLASDWLVRVKGSVLAAQRFNVSTGQLSGDPVTLARPVGIDSYTRFGSFSVSPTGTVAWRSSAGGSRQLLWFNRAGRNLGALGAADDSSLVYPEISPDGKRVAVARGLNGSRDIWIQESTRASRFTFDPADDAFPIWSPDGSRVVFMSRHPGIGDLYQKPADGSGSDQLLLQSEESKVPCSWSPDGRFILYMSTQNNFDLMILPLFGDRKPYPFLSTPFTETQGVFSPDGKWVAYQSNEAGRFEIYVRPFPGPGGQWQISTGGGTSPRWRSDGKELYYLTPDNKLMSAAATAQGGTFQPGTPEVLFQTHAARTTNKPQYDVSRDGRFLIDSELEDAVTEPIHLLLNWRPPAK
jgi:hypothetical protein